MSPADPSAPRPRFAALLEQVENWLQAQKESGADTLHANPALVRSLKDPLPVAPPPARPAPTATRPAPPRPRATPLLVAIAAESPYPPEGEALLAKMIAAMGLADGERVVLRIPAAECEARRADWLRLAPTVTVTLDAGAWAALAGLEAGPLEEVRGCWQTVEERPLMPTWGPARLLKTAADKKSAWHDLQAVLKRLGRKPPAVRK